MFNYSTYQRPPETVEVPFGASSFDYDSVQISMSQTTDFTPRIFDESESTMGRPNVSTRAKSVMALLITEAFLIVLGVSWSNLGLGSQTMGMNLLGKQSGYDAQHVADVARKDFLEHKVPYQGCQTNVMVIRHCHEGAKQGRCDSVGLKRSEYLAERFASGEEGFPKPPTYVFATKSTGTKKHRNHRAKETVKVVADRLGLEIDESVNSYDAHELSTRLLRMIQRGDMCGETVLVSWKHSVISNLVHALGCGPHEGCPIGFDGNGDDDVYMVKFDFAKIDADPIPRGEWQVFGSVEQIGYVDPNAVQVNDTPVQVNDTPVQVNDTPVQVNDIPSQVDVEADDDDGTDPTAGATDDVAAGEPVDHANVEATDISS